MNVGSGAQVRQLLFAGAPKKSGSASSSGDPMLPQVEGIPEFRSFKVVNPNAGKPTGAEPKIGKGGKPGKAPIEKKYKEMELLRVPELKYLQPVSYTASGLPAVGGPVLRGLAGKPGLAAELLGRLAEAEAEHKRKRTEVLDSAEKKFEAAAGPILLEDKPDVVRQLMDAEVERERSFAEGRDAANKEFETAVAVLFAEAAVPFGRLLFSTERWAKGDDLLALRRALEAAVALDALCEASAIGTLLSGFIISLQSDDLAGRDKGPGRRVHCSLNLNTETGRLSARRPNLQNQPALEKDRYKVRKAFTAAEGNALVVADYGQLELRLLAHMTGCRSMIEAFELGGDFHSRTAMGMYPNVRRAVEAGECLLEWGGEGRSPEPLLKV